MRALLVIVSWILTFVPFGRAEAHHPVSENGIAWVEPTPVVESSLTTASFDFDRGSGTWQSLALRAEWPIWGPLSLGASIPVTRVALDDGREYLGNGDLEVAARVLLYASEHGGFIATAGLGAGLPTGDVDRGLGSGHVELAPHLLISSQPFDHLIVIGHMVQRSALGETSDTSHGAWNAPHRSHELDLRAAAAAPFGGFYAKADLLHTVIWRGDGDPTRAGVEFGYATPRRWRVGLRGDIPVAGERRTTYAMTLAFAYQFAQ